MAALPTVGGGELYAAARDGGGRCRTVLMLHEDDDIAAYRRAIDRIMNVCLPPEVSARLIADTINQKEKPGGARAHLAQVAP